MQNIVDENKDKLSDEAKDEVNKLIESAKTMKDKEDATKEECEQELERLNKEFADWYQKHSAEINPNANA
jgi:diketogulonate reductase-like aldo/keto reductase